MKRISNHRYVTTETTPVDIGMPATPILPEFLDALRTAVASTGATTVYWFWMSLAGDRPHLGFAIAPDDNDVAARIGQAVEPLWRRYSPTHSIFDILRLGDPALDRTIMEHGELLYQRNPETTEE